MRIMYRIVFFILFVSQIFADPIYMKPFTKELEKEDMSGFFCATQPLPKNKKQEEGIVKNCQDLEKKILAELFDQDRAVKECVNAVKRYAVGILPPNQPIGKLLFYGPSGVGKTELAKLLAKHLYNDPSAFIRIDMSEYAESHTIAKLIGSPPGYVGYGENTVLSTPLLTNPYRVILLDEVEKAHIMVLRIFLQIFDNGSFMTGHRKEVDCTKTFFIMTSNLGASQIAKMYHKGSSLDEIEHSIKPYLIEVLSPELYNRLDPILFSPISDACTERLVKKMLVQLQERVWSAKQVHVVFDDSLIEYLVIQGMDPVLGARPLQRLIDKRLATAIAETFLQSSVQKNETLFCQYSEGNIIIEKKKLPI